MFIRVIYFIFLFFDCTERQHGRCAALRWLCGWALGSIGDHALIAPFIISITGKVYN
jgi:hypothetical protein